MKIHGLPKLTFVTLKVYNMYYEIQFYNFGHVLGKKFTDVSKAKDKAVSCGFECNIVEMNSNRIVATYSPIGGWK